MRQLAPTFLALAICLVNGPVHGDIYQWVDAYGVRHFSNSRPPVDVTDASVLIAEAPASSADEPETPERTIRDYRGSRSEPPEAPVPENPPETVHRVIHEHVVRDERAYLPVEVEPVVVARKQGTSGGTVVVPGVGYGPYAGDHRLSDSFGFGSFTPGNIGSYGKTFRAWGSYGRGSRYRTIHNGKYKHRIRPYRARRRHHSGKRVVNRARHGDRRGRHWKIDGGHRGLERGRGSHVRHAVPRGARVSKMSVKTVPLVKGRRR